MKVEVETKVSPVTAEEQKAFYDRTRPRYFANVPEAEALKQIEMGLGQQRMQQRRAEFAQTLRAKANVKMLLDPPRTVVSRATTIRPRARPTRRSRSSRSRTSSARTARA